MELYCHCPGCDGCCRDPSWTKPQNQAGLPCWNPPAKKQAGWVATGQWSRERCRCRGCLAALQEAAAAAATTGLAPAPAAAAANEGAAPAEVDAGAAAATAATASAAVAAAAAAKAEAAADAARQSAGAAAAAAAGAAGDDQWLADLMGRLATLEKEVQELRVELPRGRACSSSEEAWTRRDTFYLLGDCKAHAGERTSVVASGTTMPASGWIQAPRGLPSE